MPTTTQTTIIQTSLQHGIGDGHVIRREEFNISVQSSSVLVQLNVISHIDVPLHMDVILHKPTGSRHTVNWAQLERLHDTQPLLTSELRTQSPDSWEQVLGEASNNTMYTLVLTR